MASKKGMTLIEIVIAIGIIGIVAVAFLQLFGSGFINIIGAGNHSKAQFTAQDVIENDLNDRTTIADTDILEITLTDGTVLSIHGEIKTETADSGGRSVTVTYFKPLK